MSRLVPVLWLLLASVIVGASIGLAARASADGYLSDTETAYVLAYGEGAICPVITAFPSEGGVMGVAEGIMDDGFAAHDAVDIINAAVAAYCPQHWPLLQQIGARARGQIAKRVLT